MDAPSTHARFLNLLEPFVQPGSAALDIGAGQGKAHHHHSCTSEQRTHHRLS